MVELMTFPDEVYDEMMQRCTQVNVFTRRAEDRDRPMVSLGAIIRCDDDGFMTVEVGQHPDDTGFVTIRRFDRFGESMDVDVVVLDREVLITA